MQKLTLNDIKTVLILGSGTLGLRVGLQAAISGFMTKIYDINQKSLDSAKSIQIKLLKSMSSSMGLTEVEVDDVLTRIT